MSLEEALAANTAALIANTEAHANLAAVATAATGGKATTKPTKEESKEEPEEQDEAPKETAAEKKKRLAAEKKAAAAKKAAADKKKEKPELEAEVTGAELHKIASAYLKGDDEETRDTNKENFVGGLAHIGAGKLGEIESDTDRARLAAYIQYWTAGLDVDFDEIDALVEAAGGDGEGDDDLLG